MLLKAIMKLFKRESDPQGSPGIRNCPPSDRGTAVDPATLARTQEPAQNSGPKTSTPATPTPEPDRVRNEAQMVARKSIIDEHATIRRLENTHVQSIVRQEDLEKLRAKPKEPED